MIRLFSHYVSPHLLLQMVRDFLTLWGVSVVAAMLLGPNGTALAAPVLLGFALSGLIVLVAFVVGLYLRSPAESTLSVWLRAAVCCVTCMVMVVIAISLASTEMVPSKYYVLTLLAATALVITYRAYSAAYLAPRDRSAYRVLVLGTGQSAQAVTEALLTADRHAKIVGYYPSPIESQCLVPESAILDSRLTLVEAAIKAKANEIVVAITERRGGSLSMPDLLACRATGIQVRDMSSYFERTLGQIRLDQLHAGWLIFGDGFNQGWARSALKRLFDVSVCTLLLLLALPVLALATLLIKLDSQGPILYKQKRVGLNGKDFEVLKLRSMQNNAEMPGKPQWAVKADARVTRVGRVMRVTRVDELPQLVNVLRGEMSLVGPRPERPEFVNTLVREVPFYALRHSVKPGLTGWAQVRYQYGGSVEDAKEKLQFDLYYVKNHTLFLDFLVLLKTVNVVLTGKGAR